ncbi:restriction endonuclease subunit S [Streptococcus thermophilus]|uniref:restriction endonuclease subunit S n=1 Tax=Streptococcus thermophilus TaxID=1308 RepID=UPI000C2206E9|nr:restriction endonuclease subunit S [Streptococcus thermophilus]MBW7803211.1 restriction endonuclease subunit S [Streptococcus thermophilus]PJH82350.1 restriction endonuclease subunit S [Streptococcus thermophilus]
MTNSKYVPKRRFKEFELDDEWEQLKLGEHANILTGGTPNTSISSYWEPKEIPWMSSGEVNRRRLDKTDNMISNDGIRNSSARWVKKHSILIALAGQGKTRGMVAVNNIPLTTNQSIAAIEPDKTLNYEFVFQNLSKRYDELRLISSGDGSRGGLNKQIVSDISIACPNVNEQELIGNFLADFDSLITMNQHKLDKLKNLKKAYLSEMFPAEGERVPKRRLPGFEGEWSTKKLREITSLITKGTTPLEKSGEGEVNFIKVENLDASNGKILSCSKISSEEHNGYLKRSQLNENDILFSIAGTLGRIGIVESRILPANTNQALAIIRNKRSNLRYLAIALKSGSITNFILSNPTIGAQPNLSLEQVGSLEIPFPSLDEQKQIGEFFHKLDQSITLQQQKLDKLNDLKKAYLNELFV